MSSRSIGPSNAPSVYLAIHQAPYNKEKQEVKFHVPSAAQADERITGLIKAHTEQLRSSGGVHSERSGQPGGWSRAMTLLPPAASLSIGFGMVLVNTISSWGAQTLLHNIGQVCGLTAMAVAGVNAGLMYRRHQKEIEMEKKANELERIEAEKTMRLQFSLDQLEFLKESAQMAAICLEENPNPKQLSAKFLEFNLTMTGLKAGVVPNELVVEWAKIGDLIALPSKDPRRASLSDQVQQEILPRINYYTIEIQEALISLDYAEPLPEAEEKNEGDPLVLDIAPRAYNSIQEEVEDKA